MTASGIKWAIILLLGLAAAGVGSVFAQAPDLDHGIFFLLILFFLGACAWHSYQVDGARKVGGRLVLVVRRSQWRHAGMAFIFVLLFVNLIFIYRVAWTRSVTLPETVHELLLLLTIFLALLLTLAQGASARLYEEGLLCRGLFLAWSSIENIDWNAGDGGTLVVERKQGLVVGKLLKVSVPGHQVGAVNDFVAHRLRQEPPAEAQKDEPPPISLIP